MEMIGDPRVFAVQTAARLAADFAFRRRAVLTDVLNRTVERRDGWFRRLPEPPGA